MTEILVTFVADDQTPANLRSHHGRTMPMPGPPYPVPPFRGALAGIDGELDDGPDGPIWRMRKPWPPRPEPVPQWAAELGRKLDQIIDKLETR